MYSTEGCCRIEKIKLRSYEAKRKSNLVESHEFPPGMTERIKEQLAKGS